MKSEPTQSPASEATCPARLMQEHESVGAYKAFKLYWEQGDGRTIANVVKMSTNARRSIYLWSTKFRGNQRIDEQAAAVRQLWLDATARQFDKAAAALAEARLKFTLKSIEASTAMQAKGLEIVKGLQVFETVSKVVSADGKVTNVTLRPAQNIRLSDGVRLILAANYNLAAAEAGIAKARIPQVPGGKPRPDGSPAPNGVESPTLEIWVDGGDGVPMPLTLISEPDDYDPHFNPEDGITAPSNSPLTPADEAQQ